MNTDIGRNKGTDQIGPYGSLMIGTVPFGLRSGIDAVIGRLVGAQGPQAVGG